MKATTKETQAIEFKQSCRMPLWRMSEKTSRLRKCVINVNTPASKGTRRGRICLEVTND
jgi:hypothetical protein